MKRTLLFVAVVMLAALSLSLLGCSPSGDEPILGKWGEGVVTEYKADGTIEYSATGDNYVNPSMEGRWQSYGTGTATINGDEYSLYQADCRLDDTEYTRYIACSSDGSRYLEFSHNDDFQDFISMGVLPEQYSSNSLGGQIVHYELVER